MRGIDFDTSPISRLPRDHAVVAIYERAIALLAEPHQKSYWMQEAAKAVAFGSELKRQWPGEQPHPFCIVEATLEWKRLVEEDLTDLKSSDHLFHIAKENFLRNMPWVMFLETLAHWMYSNGHIRGLCLSYRLRVLISVAESTPSDA